jgi:hypothetical protein
LPEDTKAAAKFDREHKDVTKSLEDQKQVNELFEGLMGCCMREIQSLRGQLKKAVRREDSHAWQLRNQILDRKKEDSPFGSTLDGKDIRTRCNAAAHEGSAAVYIEKWADKPTKEQAEWFEKLHGWPYGSATHLISSPTFGSVLSWHFDMLKRPSNNKSAVGLITDTVFGPLFGKFKEHVVQWDQLNKDPSTNQMKALKFADKHCGVI